MRGVVLSAVVLAAMGAAIVVAGGASSGTATPSLRLLDSSPLTVKGVAFKPRERVRVTANLESGSLQAIVRATRRGTFLVTFEEISVRCGFTVRAVGAAGSRATLKLPQPACPPPLARP
jgi:hypothetical protein